MAQQKRRLEPKLLLAANAAANAAPPRRRSAPAAARLEAALKDGREEGRARARTACGSGSGSGSGSGGGGGRGLTAARRVHGANRGGELEPRERLGDVLEPGVEDGDKGSVAAQRESVAQERGESRAAEGNGGAAQRERIHNVTQCAAPERRVAAIAAGAADRHDVHARRARRRRRRQRGGGRG